jgi:hypothetical protein
MGHGLIQERKLVPEASLSPVPFTEPDSIRYCPPFRRDIPISRVDHPCLTHPFATLPGDCSPFTSDLHVLGTPPAFVLSQDQTLQICSCPSLPERALVFLRARRFCCSYLVVNDPLRVRLRGPLSGLSRKRSRSRATLPVYSPGPALSTPPPFSPPGVLGGLLLIGLSCFTVKNVGDEASTGRLYRFHPGFFQESSFIASSSHSLNMARDTGRRFPACILPRFLNSLIFRFCSPVSSAA